jgi:UDP-glucuronate 4-epimerase
LQILITGAAGFIGSALTSALAQEGHELVAIDNFSDYYSKDLKVRRLETFLERSNVKFISLDLSDPKSVSKIFNKFEFDAVIHLAAQAGVRVSTSNWNNYTRDNLVAFSNVLTSATLCRIKNFIYASSSSVYGNSNAKQFKEIDLAIAPVSFYGATKLANEVLAGSVSRSSGIKTRGLRFFTVYGPWGRPDMVYFRMIASAITKSPFDFYGDGSIERDFTYISDVVNMTSELLRDLEAKDEAFSDVVNIGGGRPISINELFKLVQDVTGEEIPFIRKAAHQSDVRKTNADFGYLNSLVGTHPSIEIESGMRAIFEWASQVNIRDRLKDWVKSVKP